MEGMQYAPPGVLPPCMCTHSALWDKRNELNHLGDCSRAIDFMGHQIKVGLAEHMPFSTRQSLSFSQINSSNYAALPTEINPEAIVPSSRNWNEEVRCRWCNLSKVVAASLTFFLPPPPIFHVLIFFGMFIELWGTWVQFWVPQDWVQLIQVTVNKKHHWRRCNMIWQTKRWPRNMSPVLDQTPKFTPVHQLFNCVKCFRET